MTMIIFAVFLLLAASGVLAQQNDTEVIEDPCENFCLNEGSCNVADNATSCNCPDRFTGDRCEKDTGTCPIFQFGSGTVCDLVVPCTNNTECGPNQKCCSLPCNLPGKTFCVKAAFPPITRPTTLTPTIPCFFGYCPFGFVCRNIMECPYCPMVAKCVRPTSFATGIDTTCKSYGYSQAILLQFPSYSNSFTQLLCKGPAYLTTSTFPAGSFCVNSGKKRRHFCTGKI